MKKTYLLALTLLTGCSTLFPLQASKTVASPPTLSPSPGATEKPKSPYLLVVNGTSKTLSKINLTSGEILENFISTGLWPNQLLVKDTTGFLVSSGDNCVSALDLAQGNKIGDINLAAGSNPYEMAFGATDRALVTNLMTGKVALLDLKERKVLKEIAMPSATAVAYANGKYYVGCAPTDTSKFPAVTYGMGTVAVLKEDTLEVLKTLETGAASNPQFMGVDPQGEVNVVCTGDYSDHGKVAVIDAKADSIKVSIPTGGAPGAIAILPGGKAYLTDSNNRLLSYDTLSETVLRGSSNPIPVGKVPMGIATDGKKVYVANFGDNNVSVIDPSTDTTVGQPWTVGKGPGALAFFNL
ncbi:MAG TPA: YncE family protein [Chroococcales cyanobacterium]